MIALDGVSARALREKGKARAIVKDVTLTWERGVLAVLGAPIDGTTALLQVLAGRVPASAGSALIDGRAPEDARTLVAYVPLEATLPEALRVEEVCELAGRIRGEAPASAAARLAPLGLEALARRRVRTLSPGEARAVSLALALSSGAKVLLIDEPLCGLAPSAPARVTEALRARAAAGAAVVVTTASVRDATRLADQLGVLTRSAFTHLPPSLAHVGPGGATLRVVLAAASAEGAAPFVAALGGAEAVGSVESAAFAPIGALQAAVAVLVSGPDLLLLARAVAAAAASTGTDVTAIESAVLPLDAIRATLGASR
jgi:ABC-2 type transport system ATP-binding protein